MSDIATADFLVEIGTEELPPKALDELSRAFGRLLAERLTENRLAHGNLELFATPRRLAAKISDLATAQPDRSVDAKGPPVSIAFDSDGNPMPPAIAFAKKCGVEVSALQRTSTAKGEWLSHSSTERGVAATSLLADIVNDALAALPIPRRMRWGESDAEFVRPVHWVMLLLGKEIVEGRILGHSSGNKTRGHRFMSAGELTVSSPGEYAGLLENDGFVIANADRRESLIREQVTSAAAAAGGVALATDELFAEVTALTEWPVAITGKFDDEFLALPAEVITASLTGHQRYFPIADENGTLLAAFVVVSNLASKDPEQVRDGNERVIRPRLADAAFFWATDRKAAFSRTRAGAGERRLSERSGKFA